MLRRVWPASDVAELDVDAPDARSTLLDWYTPHDGEYLRLNFVTTLDGRAAGSDGTSNSLTSTTDRMILGVIRQYADVVLVGAETVRREGYLRPSRAALAIVSASGDLTGHQLDSQRSKTRTKSTEPPTERSTATLVITTDEGAERLRETVSSTSAGFSPTVLSLPTASDGLIAPSAIVALLRDRGYSSIAAEGGPSFAAQLMDANLVDELCMTVMPALGGPALPLLGSAATAVWPLSAQQLLIDDAGAQYGRWSVRRPR
jgi:riboflavin biosynthesis pyrimidine reductase